jgi:hypothetical protein
MAEVYLAKSVGAEGFEKQVAINRVLAGYAENPRFAEMFISEARLSRGSSTRTSSRSSTSLAIRKRACCW